MGGTMANDDRLAILTDHYQKTFELTYEYWKQRNRIFLLLLSVIGLAALLAVQVPGTQSLFIDVITGLLGVDDPVRVDQFRGGFPFELLQSILLFIVFYLMVNLYHRNISVLRSYRYLDRLEDEIRAMMEADETSVAFTREGKFYWSQRTPVTGRLHTLGSWAMGMVKYAYSILLGFLLIFFLGSRLLASLQNGLSTISLIELVFAPFILLYFGAYVSSSLNLDSAGNDKAEETPDQDD
jgi:hypothetical protein